MLLGAGSLVLAAGFPVVAQAGTVKIAYIDALSGPFAATGQAGARELRHAISKFLEGKEVAGEKLEVEFLALDGKINPKESLVQLQNAISQGAEYIFHNSGSSVAHAIVGALEKHNKRNPDNRALYLNYGAIDPSLTGSKCSFWHFMIDANVDMKVNAMVDAIAAKPEIKKAYIIGQDYSFGKAFSAAAKRYLAQRRPDIEIVGDQLHPIGKVKDFAPYAQKILRSQADVVLTGNWGADMINLAKSIKDIGTQASIYTIYAYGAGISGVVGESGLGKLSVVAQGHINPANTPEWALYKDEFLAKHPGNDLINERTVYGVQMLGEAFVKAGGTDPLKVALALEGLEITTVSGDKVMMRAKDHQMQMPLQVMAHVKDGIKYDFDQSGYGVRTTSTVAFESNQLDSVCEMQRPL
ncbi:MAG: branched-chain amino acid ABC transporter substrate-binding protein [Oceanospirillaceae bacterium]|nr:branched-chain amino acid ABC transporter substrate-binding protein [Oceanospirillaceae bacterium]